MADRDVTPGQEDQDAPIGRPRIVHLVSCFLQRSETFTYNLIRHIHGFEHHVLTIATENLDLFPFDALTVADSAEDFSRHVARLQPCALVCHFGPMGFEGLIPALASHVPVITVLHGYDVSMILRQPWWDEPYQALLRFGSHAICVSHEGRRRLLALGCDAAKATTIHLGVDVQRFAFRARRQRCIGDPLSLLVVARLAEKKGIPVVLRAVRRLLDRGLNVSLRIVGEGEDQETLLALHARLGLEREVTFVGPLGSEGVARELAASDVLLLTSVTAANGDQEGIPVVLMEAMASGVPVIATRHSGIPELVEHERTGLLVDEGDDGGTADAIARLAADGPLGGRLAVAARARVERSFNLRRQAALFGALFTKVIREYRRPPAPSPQAGLPRRMLLVRSVRVAKALSKLVVLRHRYPEAEFWLLTREDTREGFEKCPFVSRVLTYPAAGRMDLASMPPDTMAELRDADLDRVFVPLEDDPAGYDNVLAVARACGARSVLGLTTRNDEVAVVTDGRQPATGQLR